jgi:hypothetical protein
VIFASFQFSRELQTNIVAKRISTVQRHGRRFPVWPLLHATVSAGAATATAFVYTETERFG